MGCWKLRRLRRPSSALSCLSAAKQLRKEHERQAETGLSAEELAFYDALIQSDAAVAEVGDATLLAIVHELMDLMRKDATVDWRYRDNVRATLRVKIKRLLRRHKYPPDKQESAVDLVIKQAELFADQLAA